MVGFSVELYFHETQIGGDKIGMARHVLEEKCGDLEGGGRVFNTGITWENLIGERHNSNTYVYLIF